MLYYLLDTTKIYLDLAKAWSTTPLSPTCPSLNYMYYGQIFHLFNPTRISEFHTIRHRFVVLEVDDLTEFMARVLSHDVVLTPVTSPTIKDILGDIDPMIMLERLTDRLYTRDQVEIIPGPFNIVDYDF